MPELPEVETVVRTLRTRLTGAKIKAARLNRRDIVTPDSIDLPALLMGRTIVSVDRRAKRIVVTLDDCNRFYIHLGMSGRLTAEAADQPCKAHTHFVLELEQSAAE